MSIEVERVIAATMSDLDRLEKLARDATPGPWEIEMDHHRCYLIDEADCEHKDSPITERDVYLKSEGCFEDSFTHVHESYEAHRISPCIAGNYDYEEGGIIETVDAEFIAAANPSVVLDLIARVKAAEAERDAALAAIERVRAIHFEDIAYADDSYGPEPRPDNYERHYCSEDGEDWPCPTIAALDGAPEPEVKP